MPSIKLGELLVKANVLQESQLKLALAEQQKWGGRLGDVLVRMSLVTEELIVKALSKQLGIQAVNLDAIQGIPPNVRMKVPVAKAQDLEAVPLQLRDEGKTLLVAMAEPQNIEAADALRGVTRCRVVINVAGSSAIQRAIKRFYQAAGDPSDSESSFKVVDAQGNTVVKSLPEIEAQRQALKPPPPTGPAVSSRAPSISGAFPAASKKPPNESPSDTLRSVEDIQRKEVAALKAMVELLIEKGVFTRDEYVAKVKR